MNPFLDAIIRKKLQLVSKDEYLVEQVFGCIETLWLDGVPIRDIPKIIGPDYNRVGLMYGFPHYSLTDEVREKRACFFEDHRQYPSLVEFVLMKFLKLKVR